MTDLGIARDAEGQLEGLLDRAIADVGTPAPQRILAAALPCLPVALPCPEALCEAPNPGLSHAVFPCLLPCLSWPGNRPPFGV